MKLLWSGGTRLAAYFVGLAMADVFVVTVLPMELGYPAGGVFLLTALPPIAFALVLAASLTIPLIVLSRARIGIGSAAACTVALGSLGLLNAYLWMLCVQTV